MSSQNTNEHRRFTRLLFETTARLTTQNLPPQMGQLHDISLKGALIRMPPAWSGHVADACTLEIPLGPTDVIRMEGRIAHIEGSVAGVMCIKLDLDSATHLRRLVELNLGDAHLLERELDALVA